MVERAAFRLPGIWPPPADKRGAERLQERFAETGAPARALAAEPAIRAMLDAIGGNSPYLSDLAVREAATFAAIATDGPDAVLAAELATLGAHDPASPRPAIAAALRAAKRRLALAVAIADIGGLWTLAQVTDALTTLAERTLGLAVSHLLRSAHDAGDLRLPDPDHPQAGSGFVVLGMGKLGARELNYSSDIDLILLHDPPTGVFLDRRQDGASAFYSRLARGLVALMDARDANGYVFRTDLRLRPDPGSTPPAMSVLAATTYYESMGENWERAAMSKARPVAGDLARGSAFLADIRPFVWRRGLDFAAVADIVAVKHRINAHKLGPARAAGDGAVSRVLGQNLKLGEGGVREIEFLAQTLELVWGGRDPGLRDPTTLGALALLAQAGHLPHDAAAELAEAYTFLRSVEHRLQMVADRQTHALPEGAAEFARFATFMAYPDAETFAQALIHHGGRVREHYANVFERVPEPPEDVADLGLQLDFGGNQSVPEPTLATLRAFGFTDVARVVATVRAWNTGHARALRSARARDLLGQVLPSILAALGREPNPDAVLDRFDQFLTQLPAGVQILSLFQRNPHLLDRIADVLGGAPSLADHLARHPAALDGLLQPAGDAEPQELLERRLRVSRGLEDTIAITRRTVREEDFNISVATMDGRLDADAAGAERALLADAAVGALLPRVLADFASRFGRVPGGEMAVVALGKAGGREMMVGSDLDLMLIYRHPEEETESRGARRMPAGQWFVRATQAFLAALTAPGADGPLYAIDMRLRPSGNAGPVAVSLARFVHYHAHSAWTWERMALTRARVIAGDQPLATVLDAAIADALTAAGPAATIRADALAMRARMLRDLPPNGPWDVKHRPGGLIEVEFVAQALQLIHAPSHREVCSQTTRTALANLAAAKLLAEPDAALLIRADRVWRTVQGMLRLTVGRVARDVRLPDASAHALLRACAAVGADAVDVPALRVTLDQLAGEVRAAFIRLVGEIA
ncbi:MAG: bifunctional [glutamine synthetase] adenylyltransferase/[glutamine synthetase]-adenylyl-L-tyrosine phosphorylase [Acetobacteraceae bacterium]|nr:bifunctional [glutamine synthetase] adenylyltransferase/[glutamine synthetase]-adenylyl-L-tyrosine phosphorylase [Acetobacteraceae bacterium]